MFLIGFYIWFGIILTASAVYLRTPEDSRLGDASRWVLEAVGSTEWCLVFSLSGALIYVTTRL